MTDEINDICPSILDSWMPKGEYVDYEITSIEPGRKPVTIGGRIVGLIDLNKEGMVTAPRGASGGFRIILRDDSGALKVCQRHWTRNLLQF